MVTHFSILAWESPWTEEPGGFSPWSRRVRHDLATKEQHGRAELSSTGTDDERTADLGVHSTDADAESAIWRVPPPSSSTGEITRNSNTAIAFFYN